MKNKDLIDELQKYDDELTVMVTWEGITRHIGRDHVYMSEDGILLIDGDLCFYKEDYLSGKKKADY